MKKILVLGNINSIWIKELVEHVLLNKNYEIYLHRQDRYNSPFEEFYLENGVNFIGEYSLNNSIMEMPFINSLYLRYKRKKSLIGYKFDLVLSVYSVPIELECARFIASKNTCLIAAFIGGDILRADKKRVLALKKELVDSRINVVCTSEAVMNAFKSFFPKKEATMIRFAVPSLENIEKYASNDVRDIKKEILDVSNKITICVGYNARKEQQHIKVIEALRTLPLEVKEIICIVLPMTYLAVDSYVDLVEEKIKKLGITYTILREYMSSDDVAKLRLATDIYINAQESDAFSACMLEYIYSGSIILSASWLRYKELEDWGVELQKFDDISEISQLVKFLINGGVARERKYKNIIDKNMSLKVFKNNWSRYIQEKI